jgi:hypothetical protein
VRPVIHFAFALFLAAGPDSASATDTVLDAKLNAGGGGYRCTLRGAVTALTNSSEFYLQDDSSGVKAHSPPYVLQEGWRLEVEGWMYLADSGEFQVRAKQVWRLADEAPPGARLVPLPTAFAGGYQGQLVSVRGTVLNVDFGTEYDTVSICAGRASLRAFYPVSRHGISLFEKVFPGMQVAITGISVPQTVDPEFDGYQVLLRRPSDLVIRPSLEESRAPPIHWTGSLAAMLLVVGGAWMWRRVRPGAQVQ